MRYLMNLLKWILLASVLLTSCSPASPPLATANTSEATPAGASQPVAVATSRGDKLEASDPASVKFGAGHPVLVEFFRFT